MAEPTHPSPVDPSELGFETIVYEKTPPRATIRLNRPDVLNAFDFRMLREIARACEDASWDDDVRVVVVTGEGRAFCVGADLRSWEDTLVGRPQEYWKWFGAFKDMHDRIRELGKPTHRPDQRHRGRRRERAPDGVRPRGDGRRRLHPPRRARARLGARRGRDAVAASSWSATGARARSSSSATRSRRPRRPSGGSINRAVPRAELDAAVDAWVESLVRKLPADDPLREAAAQRLARHGLAPDDRPRARLAVAVDAR